MNSRLPLLTHWLPASQLAALGLDLFLKSFIILLVAWAVCLAWRRGAAAARHLVWLLAVAGLLSLPLLSWLLPASQRPLWAVGARATAGNELTLTFELAPNLPNAGSVRQPAASSVRTAATHPATAGQQRRFAARLEAGWAASVLALWASGAALILFSLVFERLRLRALRRSAYTPKGVEWFPLLRDLCAQLQVRRTVTLLQSAQNLMPVTWGWWRPVILLPAEADEWSPERCRVVLLHELAHVKRRDCLTQMVARVACALYWFNPLVWLAAERMRVERERACDDLVLSGGCRASDYAGHLLEIARRFRRVPQVAAIAMARPSRLEGRIEAIVDASRCRTSPRSWLFALCGLAVLALVIAMAAQETEPAAVATGPRPWFDARLRAFFAAKAAQAKQLAAQANEPVAPEVWPYFAAGTRGDWQTATNLWLAMRGRAHQYEGTRADSTLDKVWSPILETDLAWEQFSTWQEKYVLAYGNDIINSIPPGSIYFGGTDPGRGVITAMSKSHAEANPFFALTQNALADGTYLDYLHAMYGGRIYTPTMDDSKKCFDEYLADALQRLKENKRKPGEQVTDQNGKASVRGQVAVMAINGLITKVIFDRNPGREFYIEESFPLDWMYPYLTPNGLIMKINRQPLSSLPEKVLQQDHQYWSRYVAPMLGGWLTYDTSASEVATFVQKVYRNHDFSGFSADPDFIADPNSQKAFAKERSSIAGIYAWRLAQPAAQYGPNSPAEYQRLLSEADFAFKQAYALCPVSPEALFRYVNLFVSVNRLDDALLLANTTLQLAPNNLQVKSLLDQLKRLKSSQ